MRLAAEHLDEPPVSEDSPQNPLTRKGAIRVELERRLQAAARRGARVILRAEMRQRPRPVRVLAREVSVQLNTWLAMHEDLRTSPRCRVTFDALLQGLLEHLGCHSSRA